jgi:hypothetical protein
VKLPNLQIRRIGESAGSIVRPRLRIFSPKGRLRPSFTILRRTLAPLKLAAGFLAAVVRVVKPRLRLSNFNICLIGATLGLAAGLVFFRHFIFNPGVPNYSDLIWPYSSHLYPMHYTWDEFQQAPVVLNQMLGYMLIYPFPAQLGIRLLYVIIFIIMGLSMFFSTFKLSLPRHKTGRVPLIAATLATLFFVLNPIIISNIMHWYLLWFYAFIPLLVYFSYTAFRDVFSLNRWGFIKRSILVALILFLMSPSPQLPYYFPFLLLALLAGFSRPALDYLKRSVLLGGLILVLYVAFSAVWLLPIAMGSSASISDSTVFSRNLVQTLGLRTSLFESFTVSAHTSTHQFWEWFKIPESMLFWWKASLVVIPVIAFGSLLLRRSKLIIWLCIFALAFMFLGKGTKPPFEGFYEWFTIDSPVISSFGWQFRWPHKWLIPLAGCYCILVGFTISFFLGWVRDRIKWRKVGKILFVFSILIFIAAPLYPGYPLLTGDLTGHLRPKISPYVGYIKDFNDWMEQDTSVSKIFYFPQPYYWGSPKPTQPTGGQLRPGLVLRGYVFVRDAMPKTTRIGELLSIWNVKYYVYQARQYAEEVRAEMLADISQQEDLDLVHQILPFSVDDKEYYHLYIYQNEEQSSPVEVSTHSVAVVGGMDHMLSLLTADSYDLEQYPVVLLDQLTKSSDYLDEADTLVSNQYSLDLYMSLLEEKYMVKPFDWVDPDPETSWIKASTAGLQGGAWPFYMRNAGLENWQQDYGEGLVWTNGHVPLNMPFGVDQDGDYHILVRYFQSTTGHSGIQVNLDDEPISEVATKGKTTEWLWEDIGTFTLQRGSHTLSIKNVRGLNAVNLFAVVPTDELERYQAQVKESLIDKRIIHIYEAESALNYSGADSSGMYAGSASNGEVLNMSLVSLAWRDIDILREGNYRLAVRLKGSVQVRMDDQTFTLTSNELDFAYLNPLHMEEGVHDLQLIPTGGQDCHLDVVWLYSTDVNGETVDDIFADDQGAQVIEWEKINPTKYKVRVSSSGPFMLSFAETYYRLWQASANGREYPSVAINSVVNGFWIEDEGELEITIEFSTQRMFYYGSTISGISIATALAFLLWNWRKNRNQSKESKDSRICDTIVKGSLRRIVGRWRKLRMRSN